MTVWLEIKLWILSFFFFNTLKILLRYLASVLLLENQMSFDSCSFVYDLYFFFGNFRTFALNLIIIYPDINSTLHLSCVNVMSLLFF